MPSEPETGNTRWLCTRQGRRTSGELEDRRLAALAAAGDESAFEAIFERHHRGLLSLSATCSDRSRRRRTPCNTRSPPLTDSSWSASRRSICARGSMPPPATVAWTFCERAASCPTEFRTASTAGLAEEVERRSDLRELVDDIGRLPEDQRAALVMSELEELGHAEVAEVLGCPRGQGPRARVSGPLAHSRAGARRAHCPCREVRQELAVARGGALRRGHLRRHLKLCPECAAFREDMDRQRRGLAVVLPVLPGIGLKERCWRRPGGRPARVGARRPAGLPAARRAGRRAGCHRGQDRSCCTPPRRWSRHIRRHVQP